MPISHGVPQGSVLGLLSFLLYINDLHLLYSARFIILLMTLIFCIQVNLLKLVPAILYQTFIFLQVIALQKLWKMFSISSKKLYSFLRYSNFCIFVFHSSTVSHCFRGCSKKNLKVYDVINCLSKNLMTHFV